MGQADSGRCCSSRPDCVQLLLRRWFGRLGMIIARRPLPFVVIPLLVGALFAAGIITQVDKTSLEYLFTPTNGKAKDERDVAQRWFPLNDSYEFDSLRLSTSGVFVHLMITPKSAGGLSVVGGNVASEIIRLDEFVRNISVPVTYQEVCAKWHGVCVSDPLVQLIEQNISDYLSLSFSFPTTGDGLYLGRSLGDIRFEAVDRISNASVARLEYWLQDGSLGKEWQNQAFKELEDFKSEIVLVEPFTSRSIEDEMDIIFDSVFSLFSIGFTLFTSFACNSLSMFDWVRTKPLIGILGLVVPGLAIVASLGLLAAIGTIVGAMPFLLIGIGLNQMFIIVHAFRHTRPEWTVEKRMRDTLADSAVSITITSLTEILAFMIGAVTFFRAVYAFCLFTGVAVLFVFCLEITFFAGCMAYDAKREAANRHAVTMRVVLPKSLSEDKSRLYKVFCIGGVKHKDQVVEEQTEHLASYLLRQYYGPFLKKKVVKVIVLILYLCYVGVAIYGCTQVELGIDDQRLVRDDSVVGGYLMKLRDDFTVYTDRISFMRTSPADYWDPTVQAAMDRDISKVLDTQYVGSPSLVTWWLHDYVEYLQQIRGNRTVTQSLFMTILQNDFLQRDEYIKFKLDISFSGDRQAIEATRFFVQTNNITNQDVERDMIVDLRSLAEDLDLVAYNPSFIFYDQYVTVVPGTLQSIGIALGAVLVVAILIIPHPWCAIVLFLSVMSIVTGVIGIMYFWGVYLDTISMITLIMSVAFSVEFSSHITFAYTRSSSKTRDDQMTQALHVVGYPIVQLGISAVLGIFPIAFSDSYIFQAFFKTIFLAIFFGFLHGFLVLPVVLSLIGVRGKASDYSEVASDTNASPFAALNPLSDVIRERGMPPQDLELNVKATDGVRDDMLY